jgi:hypothetical protein
MIDKAKIIYKGDMITGIIFMVVGFVAGLISLLLFLFASKVGFYFLAIGMSIFSLYGFVKGILLYVVGKSRYKHYLKFDELSLIQTQNEIKYTQYRLDKKVKNRRRYAWTFVIASLIGFAGIFTQEKGLIIGTVIPIALFAASEFSMGLLVEFRLWEYQRRLSKSIGIDIDQ